MNSSVLVSLVAAYVLLLFAIGRYGDRWAVQRRVRSQPLIWSMALAVYCTSWTYFGAVGRAAESPWSYLPIYLGPALIFLFAHPVLRRMIELSKHLHLTSVADFIAARHGHDRGIAVLVTLVSTLSVLPYIALQLKAIDESFRVLAPLDVSGHWDVAMMTAVGLGGFALLFGTRQINASESHRGLTLAVAFESAFKLLVFLLVAVIVLQQAEFPALHQAGERLLAEPPSWISFLCQTVLAGMAVLCLPRQFQMTVVENTDPKDLDKARWYFPLYLLLISVFVVPLAELGRGVLPGSLNADTYMLHLPLEMGSETLATLAYLGGFSAGTAMIVVSSIALGTMLSNEIATPWLLRRSRLRGEQDWGRQLKLSRRIAISLILLMAYVLYRFLVQAPSLASIGLLAFVGIVQLAPALLGAMYWPQGNRSGAFWGMLAGTAVWFYTLLLPSLMPTAVWIEQGPFAWSWLRPQQMFGLSSLDPVSHATFLSLSLNLGLYVLLSRLTRTRLGERLDAARFTQVSSHRRPQGAPIADLLLILERFYGRERSRILMEDFARQSGQELDWNRAQASPEMADYVERLLAGAMGGANAAALMDAALGDRGAGVTELAHVLEQTSRLVQFNRELLQSALDNLSQAVSVVDANQRLVAWNRGYQSLFDLPAELLKVGEPIENILRLNARRGLLGSGEAEEQIQRRLAHLRAQSPHRQERVLPDGRVLDVQGQPLPDGGFVTSFADVTDFKRVQQELEQSNLELEDRVARRTEELQAARAEAENANRSKTRFLAAASHDLRQPLNAARLFASAVAPSMHGADAEELIQGIEQSLESMEGLLGSLLDISKLDAGALPTRIKAVSLNEIFSSLQTEFALSMKQRGLDFRVHPTSLWVESDAALLKRILQNFISNALRYTEQGRVVLGARRCGDRVRVEVLDSGRGIAAEDQQRVFGEFQRLGHGEERGFGLGLAICERIARLLDHPLSLRSQPGRGSAFCLELPRAEATPASKMAELVPERRRRQDFRGLKVLCVDNDPAVLKASQALLERWGCVVALARSGAEARQQLQDAQLLILDYHLDDDELGTELLRELRAQSERALPAIVVTADHSGEADEAARELGCGILRKPLKPAALRALISRLRLP